MRYVYWQGRHFLAEDLEMGAFMMGVILEGVVGTIILSRVLEPCDAV